MGTNRNIQIGILLEEVLILLCFTYGFYHFIHWIDPMWVYGTGTMRRLLVMYGVSFIASYAFFPSIIQYQAAKSEDIVKRILSTCGLMLLFVVLISVATRPSFSFPKKFLCLSVALFAIILFVERFFVRRWLRKYRSKKKEPTEILLIGNEQTVYNLFDTFSSPTSGYKVVGTFYDGICMHEGMKSLRIGGIDNSLYEWLMKHPNIKEIYGYFPKEQQGLISIISKFCDNHLIRFFYVPSTAVFHTNMTCEFIGNIPIIVRREEPLRNPLNRLVKRTFDIFFSGLVLLCIFPWVWLIVAIVIKIQSPGPIFFVQKRTGLDGKIFNCIKFRSMHVNKDADTRQATKDDPRKFPFGNLMRKLNIDELPQFINVMKGEMSVVGPRPHMLKHTEEYSQLINRFMVRHLAQPGITGLAQVSGFRGETRYLPDMEGRVKKDIEYIENWTFLLDIKIIVKTVTNALGREKGNAY